MRNLDRTQRAIAAIVLVIVAGAAGFLAGRSVERRQVIGDQERAAEQAAAIAGTLLVGANAIAVDDQTPGMQVGVKFVTLERDGWVAIHEDRDGKPGNILGAQLFLAGQNQQGSVDLLRGTADGKVYYAMLHGDDGDRTFEHTKDLPLKDAEGNVIFQRFLAASQPTE